MSDVSATTGAGFIPAAVPSLDHLTDSGRWREMGVTHWHLINDEIGINDGLRYTAERWHGLAGARFLGHTADPREALRWVLNERMAAIHRASHPEQVARTAGYGSEAEWLERAEMTWFMLTHAAKPGGGGLRVSDGRAADIYAEPMTPFTCSKH